jgi:hypothetical protein
LLPTSRQEYRQLEDYDLLQSSLLTQEMDCHGQKALQDCGRASSRCVNLDNAIVWHLDSYV